MIVETDHTGMAVEPWKVIDFDGFEENVISKVGILVFAYLVGT